MTTSIASGASIVYTKNIVAGTNVTITETPTSITISASGGGGGGGVQDITVTFDGDGQVLTTGNTGIYWTCPYNCTITGWYINADQSGSVVLDVWKTVGIPTNANSITGTEKPTLSTQQQNSDTSLSSWTTAVTAGDTFGFEVESATTVTKVVLSIRVTT
jgi:hypothetical protein